jgi:hypothetical protein
MGGGEHGTPREKRVRSALIAVVAAGAVGAVAVLAWPTASHGMVVATSKSPSGAASGSPGGYTAADSKRDRETIALLNRRSKALLAGDLAGWLADVDPQLPALVAHQRLLFSNLRKLPLAKFGWTASGTGPSSGYAVPETLSSKFVGAKATYSGAYVLRYQFRGYDKSEIADSYAPVFLLRADKWQLAGDQTSSKSDTYRVEPWDKTPIAVGTGKLALVVVSASDAKKLPALVSQADAALRRVASMWPGGTQKAVLYDSRDVGVFANYLGSGRSTNDFGGVTVSVGPDDASASQQDLRVVVNPVYAAPGSKQLPSLLTHEFTHVAKWTDRSDGTPTWAIEGIAEYTAFRGHPQDQRVSAKIGKDGGTGHLPKSLPRSQSFYSGATVDYDYGMAWLAFEYISAKYGENKVRLLYERLAKISAPADSSAALKAESQAFRAVVHMSESKFLSGLDKWIAQVIRPVRP